MITRPPLALLVTDRIPPAKLGEALLLAGYEVDLVPSIDTAVLSLNQRVPSLVLAGPFRRDTPGLDFFIPHVLALSARVIVLSDEPALIALAQRHGVQVRSPSLDPLESSEPAWLRPLR